MTEGDYDGGGPAADPLKVARLRLGWSQAAAMRRFQDAVTRHGASAPTGASLKRMFAYWEAGERAVRHPEMGAVIDLEPWAEAQDEKEQEKDPPRPDATAATAGTRARRPSRRG